LRLTVKRIGNVVVFSVTETVSGEQLLVAVLGDYFEVLHLGT